MDLIERSADYKARLGPSSDSDQDEEADNSSGYMIQNKFFNALCFLVFSLVKDLLIISDVFKQFGLSFLFCNFFFFEHECSGG